MNDKMKAAYEVLDQHLEENDVDVFWVLVSGGHDSLAALAVSASHPKFGGVIHSETATGPVSHMITQFVRRICDERGYPLFSARPATTYLMLVTEHGFPGPAAHSMVQRYLKDRVFRQCKKKAIQAYRDEHELPKSAHPNVAYVTGMRRQESDNRASLPVSGVYDSTRYIAPLYDWSKHDCKGAIAEVGLPLNPVSQLIGISGECQCAAHAGPFERHLLLATYDEQRQWVESIERVVAAAYAHQRLEVEMGIRDPEYAMDEAYMTWAHGSGTPPEQGFMEELFFCRACAPAEKPEVTG